MKGQTEEEVTRKVMVSIIMEVKENSVRGDEGEMAKKEGIT